MNFIITQNFKYKNKFLGFIDYQTIILNIIFDIIMYKLLSIFIVEIYIQILLLIILCFPFLLLSIFFSNNENILNVILYIYTYVKNPKIYIYKKF